MAAYSNLAAARKIDVRLNLAEPFTLVTDRPIRPNITVIELRAFLQDPFLDRRKLRAKLTTALTSGCILSLVIITAPTAGGNYGARAAGIPGLASILIRVSVARCSYLI